MHDGGDYGDRHRALIGTGTTPAQGTDTSLQTEIDRSMVETDIMSNYTVIFERTYPQNELNADTMSEAAISAIPETDDFWGDDLVIVNGLTIAPGTYSYPGVFQMIDTWYLISGDDYGHWNGFKWDSSGSTWVSHPAIVNGLPTLDNNLRCKLIKIDNVWNIIIRSSSKWYQTWNTWDGTIWVRNTTYEEGLDDSFSHSIPNIFHRDGSLYFIRWNQDDPYQYPYYAGYIWSGSKWQRYDDIVEGLPVCDYYANSSITEIDGIWFLIIGSNGYRWKGSEWISDTEIVSNIAGGSIRCLFLKDDYWQCITGDWNGVFKGSKEVMNPGILMNRSVFTGFEKTDQFKLRISTHVTFENE